MRSKPRKVNQVHKGVNQERGRYEPWEIPNPYRNKTKEKQQGYSYAAVPGSNQSD